MKTPREKGTSGLMIDHVKAEALTLMPLSFSTSLRMRPGFASMQPCQARRGEVGQYGVGLIPHPIQNRKKAQKTRQRADRKRIQRVRRP